MAGCRYLSNEKLQGFNYYKYSCIDTNPISVYIFQPWWRTAVKIVPLWVAPNLLTLIGFLLLLINFLLFAYFDYDYNTTGNDLGIQRTPIPMWAWLYVSIAHFIAHTLDGIDGKQARRTNSSSPLGELFDHGLDSMGCILIPLTLFSIVGRGSVWGVNPKDGYWAALAIISGFYLSHWEKYVTGTMCLPWAYDTGEFICVFLYSITGIFGTQLFQFNIIPGWNPARIFRYGIIIGFFLTIPSTLNNVYQALKSSSNFDQRSTVSVTVSTSSSSPPPSHGGRSFFTLISPFFSFFTFFSLFTFWTFFSPTSIIDRDPRLYMLTVGVVFSNVVCRLIIAQMSGHNADLFNFLFIPVAMTIGISFYQPQYELIAMYGLLVVVVLAHLHFGASVPMSIIIATIIILLVIIVIIIGWNKARKRQGTVYLVCAVLSMVLETMKKTFPIARRNKCYISQNNNMY